MSKSKKKRIEQGYEAATSWINGNRGDVDKWIGNSATRLLYVLNGMAAQYGSEEVRRFVDSIHCGTTLA